MTAPPPPIRTLTTSRDSSSTKQTSDYSNPPQLDPFPLSSPFEERFPQPTSTFSLPHSRTASSSSSVSTDSARSNGHASGGGFTKLPRTTSSSTWGDFSHDVELLLGEEGRGKSPSRNGGPPPRSTTPSRSNSQLSQQSQSRWNLQDYNVVDGPSTPRSHNRVEDDQDTTPKGQLSERSPISNQSQFSSSTRPLHTPPQLLPSSIFDRTSSSSPHSRSRMTSHASSSSALRPPSAQSHSSNSSTYSLEDNSWATDLAPPLHSDDEEGHELTSPRSPFLMMETRRNGGSNEVQATRPLSEFDFAAAYARSDGGGSIPGSPMLPTVGIVEPASPVAASNPNSTDRRFEDSNFSSSKPPSTETVPLPRPLSDPSTLHPEPQPPLETTPSSSRAPSPTPSLSPNIRPTSRASSTTTRSNLSSPVRPPRRQPSNLSLVPPKPEQQQPSTSSSSSSSSSPPHKGTSSSSVLPENSPNPIVTSSSLPPSSSSSSSNPTSPSPRGSPRPPSIPEKSRRRASTLGLGLKKGHGRKESRDLVVEGEGEKGGSRPGSVFESRDGDVTGGGGGIGNGNGLGTTTSFTNPNTPLSASDFAEVYGKLDPEWDDTSSINSSSIVTGPRSTTTSPIISRSSKQRQQQLSSSSSSTSHVRDPAASLDCLDLPETTRTVGSLAMEERSGSNVSTGSDNERRSTTTTGGRETDEDVFSDARTGVSPNPVSSPRFESLKMASLNGGVDSEQGGGGGENRLLEVTWPGVSNSRSTTPKGDAKARAAAFIADLKKSREEAGNTGGGAGGVLVRPVEEDETIKVQNRVQNRPDEEEDTATIASNSRIAQAVPAEGSTGRTSESSTRPPSRSQPSSRSSTLPHPSSRVTQQQPPPRQATLPPLLRRRPLPMAIQASGELTRARTAGERARIYASKINELSREKSRLDEWIDAVRNPRSAMGRAAVASPTASPLKTARSFRQDASTATFAPRGDGYRAKEITHSTFGPRDLQSATSPYPGVLGYNLTPATSASSSIGPSSQQRSLGSGLPAVSIQPGGGSNGGGKPSFFSRSLGRRTSKREPPSSSALLHGAGGGGGGGVAGLPISNPSPLLYSSSSTTTPAPQNLRSIGGPRMPGAGGGPTLNSRASFDSRSSTPTNSPLFQLQTSNPYQKRESFSFASNAISPPSSSILHSSMPLIDSTPLPTSPNSFTSVSTSPSPLLLSTTNPNSFEEGIDQGALSRLIDVLPQAPREELVKSLRKAGGGDDILAISIYLSEREAGISGK
ncbi:hypothetical protein JCM16303_004214 [Sporobolomyces ruberrimus]